MIDAMLLRGFAPRTQEAYCAAVVALAKHFRRSPDTLSAEQLQSYLLHLITKKKLAYASVNQAACAFRFMFGTVLRWPEVRFDIPMAKVPKRLPQILSREEVTRLIHSGATLRGRTLLTTTYAAGLRVSEVCALQLADIESAPDRMCLKVRQGKGGQDRYTLLFARACSTRCAATGAIVDRASGCFPTPRAARRSISRRRSGSTAPPATPPASPAKAASTPCATLSPLTCSRPAWTCPPSSDSWATATSARPCAICIWRAAV
jgi:integrase